MDPWEIVVGIVVLVLVLLFVGGYVANARIRRSRDSDLTATIAAADGPVAEARAQARGWDRDLLGAAARSAFAARHPGLTPTAFDLVQVVDRPGPDEAAALMRVTHAAGDEEIELRRSGDAWAAA